MKVFISKNNLEGISKASKGSIITGTYSSKYKVATVVDLIDNKEFPVDRKRTVLGIIGEQNAQCPFTITNNGSSTIFHSNWTIDEEVKVREYSESDFFKRTPFDTEIVDYLKKKRVLIIGLGSVGAPMALDIAKSGVGAIIGVDQDVLEIHNCMRHVLGSEYVGWPKPQALEHFLKEQAPATKFIPIFENLFSDNRSSLKALIEEQKPTHLLAVTDNVDIQYLCQLTALYYKLPMMAVSCDNNAVEGEIFMYEPGQAIGWQEGRTKRGCYACMRNPSVGIERSKNFDYSEDEHGSYGGELALSTFINRINNIASIFLNAWLLKDCPKSTKLTSIFDNEYDKYGLQYIRLGGPYSYDDDKYIKASAPWSVDWMRVNKKVDCPLCGNTDTIEERLFPTIKDTDKNWGDFETIKNKGGI